jgi:hypothetical protein
MRSAANPRCNIAYGQCEFMRFLPNLEFSKVRHATMIAQRAIMCVIIPFSEVPFYAVAQSRQRTTPAADLSVGSELRSSWPLVARSRQPMQ